MSIQPNKFYHGKMEVVLKDFPDNYFDSIVTDPPYGISFMGNHWDYDVPSVDQWKEAFRVLKPGGFLLSFGGTRTYHRMVVNIEDAGFEIKDQIQWLYGQGFPKSMDISKQIDKQAGADREVIGVGTTTGKRIPGTGMDDQAGYTKGRTFSNSEPVQNLITAAATDEAKQ
jgi:DNA modification methylase